MQCLQVQQFAQSPSIKILNRNIALIGVSFSIGQAPFALHVLDRIVVEIGHDALRRLTEAEARRAAFWVAHLQIECARFAVFASVAICVLLAQALGRKWVTYLRKRAFFVAIALVATREVPEAGFALFAAQAVRAVTASALTLIYLRFESADP